MENDVQRVEKHVERVMGLNWNRNDRERCDIFRIMAARKGGGAKHAGNEEMKEGNRTENGTRVTRTERQAGKKTGTERLTDVHCGCCGEGGFLKTMISKVVMDCWSETL